MALDPTVAIPLIGKGLDIAAKQITAPISIGEALIEGKYEKEQTQRLEDIKRRTAGGRGGMGRTEFGLRSGDIETRALKAKTNLRNQLNRGAATGSGTGGQSFEQARLGTRDISGAAMGEQSDLRKQDLDQAMRERIRYDALLAAKVKQKAEKFGQAMTAVEAMQGATPESYEAGQSVRMSKTGKILSAFEAAEDIE